MKQILFTVVAATLLLTSCLNSDDDNNLVYLTYSEFKYKVQPDLFKVADVVFCVQDAENRYVGTLDANNDTLSFVRQYYGTFDSMTLGFELQIQAKDTSEWEKQDYYAIGGDYNNEFVELLTNDKYERLLTDQHSDEARYSYNSLKENIDTIVARYNASHRFYYTWTRQEDTRYKVTKIKF